MQHWSLSFSVLQLLLMLPAILAIPNRLLSLQNNQASWSWVSYTECSVGGMTTNTSTTAMMTMTTTTATATATATASPTPQPPPPQPPLLPPPQTVTAATTRLRAHATLTWSCVTLLLCITTNSSNTNSNSNSVKRVKKWPQRLRHQHENEKEITEIIHYINSNTNSVRNVRRVIGWWMRCAMVDVRCSRRCIETHSAMSCEGWWHTCWRDSWFGFVCFFTFFECFEVQWGGIHCVPFHTLTTTHNPFGVCVAQSEVELQQQLVEVRSLIDDCLCLCLCLRVWEWYGVYSFFVPCSKGVCLSFTTITTGR